MCIKILEENNVQLIIKSHTSKDYSWNIEAKLLYGRYSEVLTSAWRNFKTLHDT